MGGEIVSLGVFLVSFLKFHLIKIFYLIKYNLNGLGKITEKFGEKGALKKKSNVHFSKYFYFLKIVPKFKNCSIML